ncbi:MAG: hypothetical protein L0229_27600 [Blastocatellia bacterium]|nr:hypothetical protein [Blastocatellia bacterium]
MKPDKKTEAKTNDTAARREVLRGAGALLGLALLSGSAFDVLCAPSQRRSRSKRRSRSTRRSRPARPAVTGPLSGNDLYKDVIAYYNLGEHRTATQVDERTSDWLAAQLRAAGLRTQLQPFSLEQFFLSRSGLTVAGQKMRAFPLWPARGTGPTPVSARLAAFGPRARSQSLEGRIALIKFPFDRRASVLPEHVKIIGDAARAGASAVIAVTEGPTGEIIAMNTSPSIQPWPLPVALVAGRNWPELSEAAVTGAEASLLIDGREDPDARALNVIGRLQRGKDLIVVSTPQSGWFRCAGERGPGIALFLGLARWAAKRNSDTSFMFVSTSGHELGNLGIHSFHEKLAPRPDKTLVWLHLGAGIATFEWEETSKGMRRLSRVDSNRYLMCSPNLEPLLAEKFAGQPGLTPITNRAVGEMEAIKKAGYRSVAIAAGHRFHHTPADNPDTTGPQLLEPIASALAKTIEEIEAKTSQ